MRIGKRISNFGDDLVSLDAPWSKHNTSRPNAPVYKIKNIFEQPKKIDVHPISVQQAIKLQGRIELVRCSRTKSKD